MIMALRLMFVLHLGLVGVVAANVVYAFHWPEWAVNTLVGGLAGAVVVMGVVARMAQSPRRAGLGGLQVVGTLGLLTAAGALVTPAWGVLMAGEGAVGVVAAGRMAPLFVTALALYAANLWLDATRSAEEQVRLERLARLLGGPRLLPALITAVLMTAGLIIAMDWGGRNVEAARVVTHRFLERGIIPPLTVLLFFWGLLLLLGKQWNTWYLRRAVRRWGGRSGGGVESSVAVSLEALVQGEGAMEESMALLWQRYEESYLFPRYISWAVPVLGFIGTVLGISLAADGIRRIIGSDSGLSGLSGDLSGAIAPLGIAFDTTLIALSLSVALTLLLALVQREEERMLATLEWEVRGARRGS